MKVVLFVALFFGAFSLLCVALWVCTDPRFRQYAFQKPAVTRTNFLSKDKELSDWLVMYYTTRVFLVCFVVLMGYYLYRMVVA